VGLDVKEINSLGDIPLIGFAFPLVGLFIAPIYPLKLGCFKLLASKTTQLDDWVNCRFFCSCGTIGSRVIGYLFKMKGLRMHFITL
jgi:anaerobic C4-dicarboxylate transporter